ncbi:MAG TPA: hypothetical protein VGM21_00560 [Actinomycetota bacterium]|jgi:hypothetical protein
MASDRSGPTTVYLEVGSKRVFACSLDWPGWARSGKTDELALEALADYAPRYAVVAGRAGIAFPATVADELQVVERLPGSATTNFGAPGEVASADAEPVSAAQAERTAGLLRASWAVFDQVAAAAPAELRKGPRGGGRDRDKMVDHVLGAEAGYARMIGVKRRPPPIDDQAAIEDLREAIVEVLGAPSDGKAPRPKGWPARYAARRIAWHVLDHAWEMQDRSSPSA